MLLEEAKERSRHLSLGEFYIFNLLHLRGADRLNILGGCGKTALFVANIENWYSNIKSEVKLTKSVHMKEALYELNQVHKELTGSYEEQFKYYKPKIGNQ